MTIISALELSTTLMAIPSEFMCKQSIITSSRPQFVSECCNIVGYYYYEKEKSVNSESKKIRKN